MPLSPPTAAICSEWRGLVELRGGWRRSPNQAGVAPGEAGGYFVELSAWAGRRAYLKPTRKQSWKRAAREKIAADLAFDLGVTAPPVVLVTNETDDGHERHACASLVLFERQYSWGQIRDLINDHGSFQLEPLRKRLPGDAARALAFDAWLDQTDHVDGPALEAGAASNILYGYSNGTYEDGHFVFLDYSFSMGISGSWDGGGFQSLKTPAFPPSMLSAIDQDAIEATLQSIENFGDADLEGIVTRVPWQWLPEEEGTKILAGLKARRSLVRKVLERYLVAQ